MPCSKYKKTVESLRKDPEVYIPEGWEEHARECEICSQDLASIKELRQTESVLRDTFKEAHVALSKTVQPKLKTKEERLEVLKQRLAQIPPEKSDQKVIRVNFRRYGSLGAIAALLIAGVFVFLWHPQQSGADKMAMTEKVAEQFPEPETATPPARISREAEGVSTKLPQKKKTKKQLSGVRREDTPVEEPGVVLPEETASAESPQTVLADLWSAVRKNPKDEKAVKDLVDYLESRKLEAEISKLKAFLKKHGVNYPR